MNANDCILTIVITYNDKKIEMKSKNLIKLEDVKKYSIEQFNITKEDQNFIKYTYMNSDNKPRYIECTDDLIKYSDIIDEDNYIINLILIIEKDKEKRKEENLKNLLQKMKAEKDKLKDENEKLRKEMDNLKNKNKNKNSLIINNNNSFTIKGNEDKYNKLKKDINDLNNTIKEKNNMYIELKQEKIAMLNRYDSLEEENAKINNLLKKKEDEKNKLKEDINDLNIVISEQDEKFKKLDKLVDIIKDNNFYNAFNEMISDDNNGKEVNDDLFDLYKDLIISIDKLVKKELKKKKENYLKNLENKKEEEKELKNKYIDMLYENIILKKKIKDISHKKLLFFVKILTLFFIIVYFEFK